VADKGVSVGEDTTEMFLNRLMVTGFKSYTEPVEVHFSPNISVIIGGNGVGKSNALDAIVWALGEDDSRSLRCGRGEDLLFAGSELNPPADEARVELTFERDGQEYVVTRCLARSGKESFLVGDAEFPTLDVFREALESLGLGGARLDVIRQEELTDFFVRSSDDRKRYLTQFVAGSAGLETLSSRFEGYLSALIPGSRAKLIVDGDGTDTDVEVSFPDKGAKRGVLLSGGEKAITSLALKLALFDSRPSPMYLLDEVEPALDWTRNHNMQDLLKKISQERQLIMVTHIRSTIQMANTVHGVRVRADGSSWLKFHFEMDDRLFKVYRCC